MRPSPRQGRSSCPTVSSSRRRLCRSQACPDEPPVAPLPPPALAPPLLSLPPTPLVPTALPPDPGPLTPAPAPPPVTFELDETSSALQAAEATINANRLRRERWRSMGERLTLQSFLHPVKVRSRLRRARPPSLHRKTDVIACHLPLLRQILPMTDHDRQLPRVGQASYVGVGPPDWNGRQASLLQLRR